MGDRDLQPACQPAVVSLTQSVTSIVILTPGFSHDCPQVNAAGLAETGQLAQEEAIDLVNRSEGSSWKGGRVVLVATEKPTSEWKPIAQRVL